MKSEMLERLERSLASSNQGRNITRLLEERAKLFTVLKEMVQMMDCGDEPGAGSKWHEKAKEAIAFAESE